jgi:uncharacterized protein
VTGELHLIDQPRQHRYAARLDDEVVGIAAYYRQGDIITFTHTEVAGQVEGQGIGSRLARYALDDARAQGWRVRPRCPFIRDYLDRHPEYADLVVE